MSSKPNKKEQALVKKESSESRIKEFKSFDDFNLAEFPIAPLYKSTQDLQGKVDTVSFKMKVKNKKGEEVEKPFFYSREYGNIVPNNDTEDVLLLLIYLLQKSEDKYTVHTSASGLLRLKGVTVRPNQKQLQAIIRHIEALRQMRIETNFNYDLKNKRWRNAVSSVIASYSFVTIGERAEVSNTSNAKDFEKSLKDVQRLESVSFSPEFIKSFFDNPYSLNLNTYFSLQDPIPKRIYRFANKYLEHFGQRTTRDLWDFCWINIGMRGKLMGEETPEDKFQFMKHIASKLKKHIERINDTGEFEVYISRLTKRERLQNKSFKSGYSITFARPHRLFALSDANSYTRLEQKAYNDMLFYGIYGTAAKKFIVRFRTQLHARGAKFILYTIQMTADYINKNKIKILPQNKNKKTPFGGLYYQAIDEEWFYDLFLNKEKGILKRERKETNVLLGMDKNTTGKDFATLSEMLPISQSNFDMNDFIENYPEAYRKIKENRTAYYEDGVKIFGDNITPKEINRMMQNSIQSYCKECFFEFEKGNADFLPNMT